MAEAAAKSNQGKRYTAEEKAEIAQFIAGYNKEHKRGGMKAASEKYGVSVVTLSNWGKKKKASGKKKVKAKKAAAKVVKKAVAKKAAPGKETALKRMQAILVEIAALEQEYNALKKTL